MFVRFLRQSSVVPPWVGAFDPTIHLMRADTRLAPSSLAITTKWSKTILRAADLRTVLLPATADPAVCPVSAYRRDIARAPPAPDSAPLIAFRNANWIASRFITCSWNQALKDAGPLAYGILPVQPQERRVQLCVQHLPC